MPFTLAHPAAVMPLRHLKYLPTLALIVGSMIPDILYYVPGRIFWTLRAAHWDTHSLFGSVFLCLPLGMLVIAGCILLRRPLTALMTDRARWVVLQAADSFTARPINWLLAVPAILIGSWTHLLWDAFTHPGTWLVRRVDALSAPITLFGVYTGEVSHVLQYASSVIGLLVLAWWYTLAASEAPLTNSRSQSGSRWLLLLLVVVAAAIIGTVQALRAHYQIPTFYSMAYLLLTRTLAWFLLLYVAAGTVLMLSERAQPQLES